MSGLGSTGAGTALGSTSTSWPSTSRTLPDAAGSPSTRTPPAAIVAAASALLRSPINATMRSSRSPASAAGTCSTITPLIRSRPGTATRRPPMLPRRACGTRRQNAAQDQERCSDGDGHVGDVEDREPLQVDEVDHGTVEPCVAAEQPVDQVAGRPADQQPHADGAESARLITKRHEQVDDHDGRHHADHRAQPTALTERHAVVERQVEPKGPDEIDHSIGSERGDGPVLGELIDDHDRCGDGNRRTPCAE